MEGRRDIPIELLARFVGLLAQAEGHLISQRAREDLA